MSSASPSRHRWRNNVKTLLLCLSFPCLLVGLIAFYYGIDGYQIGNAHHVITLNDYNVTNGAWTQRNLSLTSYVLEKTAQEVPYVVGFAALWVFIGLLFHDWFVRMATAATPVQRKEQPEIYNLLENLCITAGAPIPKLYIIKSRALNAYASGLGSDSFTITLQPA